MSECKIKDESGNCLEVSEWPDHLSDHLKSVFSVPEEEKHKVLNWIQTTSDECIRAGHNFSAKQLSEGAVFSNMPEAQNTSYDNEGTVLLCICDGSFVESGAKRKLTCEGVSKRRKVTQFRKRKHGGGYVANDTSVGEHAAD
eukprot:1335111-Karenia_brevis.AAC.1